MTELADIAGDASADFYEQLARIAALFEDRPDHGAQEVVDFFSTSDVEGAQAAATYLGLLADLESEKTAVVESALERGGRFPRAVTWPLRSAAGPAVDAAVQAYLADSKATGTFDLAFEAGLFRPRHLLPHRDRIDDELLRLAMLAGAPDAVVEELESAYRDDPNPETLRALASVRTDRALSALIDLRPLVPEPEHDTLDLYLELGGVFPDTQEAATYPKTLRGFVAAREAAPHHMGAGLEGLRPGCPVCATPATRVLTVDAAALEFDLSHDAPFFWFSCDCGALDFIFVEHADGGRLGGLMVPMTDREPDEPIVPGSVSLVLEDHPNQHGYGVEVSSAIGLHQVGGYAPWLEFARHPHCPRCSRQMRFLAAVDSGPTPFGEMRFAGVLYGFWCDDDAVSCTMRQDDEIM